MFRVLDMYENLIEGGEEASMSIRAEGDLSEPSDKVYQPLDDDEALVQ